MKTVALKALYRDQLGKERVKKLRKEKRIPAVVYGSGVASTSISVTRDDFFQAVHTKAGGNAVIQLGVSGEKSFEKTVLIKEIQHNVLTDEVEHVDFQVISLTEKIKVQVPVRVIGEAPGVKEGGVLDVVHHEIEVECLPTQIPERIDVEITSLKIGSAIHMKELIIPKGVSFTLPEDEVIIAVHAPKAEEVAPVEEGAQAPEVIKKEGKEGKEDQPAEAGAPEAKKAPAAEKEKK